MKTLAILITAFNAEKYILETLQSFESQLLPLNWNINYYIGVDACKNTFKILQENNISFYYTKENVGTYILTNSLLEKAKKDNCDMFLRFDSDDLARENFLLHGIQHTEKLNFVRPYYNFCTSTGKPKGVTDSLIAHGPVFMSRTALEKLGGYHHHRVACDSDLIARAELLGYYNDILKEERPLFYYRKLPNSLTRSKKTAKHSEYRKNIINQMDKFRSEHGTKIFNPVTTKLKLISFK